MNDAEYLANVTAKTGAYTELDRDITFIAVRSENVDEVKESVEHVNERVSEHERLNYAEKGNSVPKKWKSFPKCVDRLINKPAVSLKPK